MQTLLVVQRIIDSLRRPWIQRLITLVVSALLMMSLISTTIPLVLPQAGHAITSSVSGKLTERAHQDEVCICGLVSSIHVRGQREAQTQQITTEKGGPCDPDHDATDNAHRPNHSLT